MIFLLIQQIILIFSNWFLTFPDADPAIINIINGFEPSVVSLQGHVSSLSYFIPIHDLFFFLYVMIALQLGLYATAFTMWVIRIVTLGVIK